MATRWEPGDYSWELSDIRPLSSPVKIEAIKLTPYPSIKSCKKFNNRFWHKRCCPNRWVVLILSRGSVFHYDKTNFPNAHF